MKKIAHIARNHREADEWDILQQISMAVEQRLEIAKSLKKRFYGEKTVDIREYYKTKNDKK